MPVSNEDAFPEMGWKEVALDSTKNNPDVIVDRPGHLNRRSYDVTMLPNISNVSTWENRSIVYKYPFEASEIVSSETSKYASQYGEYVNYLNYQNKDRRRYFANTVFLKLMRPQKTVYMYLE